MLRLSASNPSMEMRPVLPAPLLAHHFLVLSSHPSSTSLDSLSPAQVSGLCGGLSLAAHLAGHGGSQASLLV